MTVNLIFLAFWHSAVSKVCAISSKLIDYTPEVNPLALVYLTAFRIENSTQYGRFEKKKKKKNKKPLKPKKR